MTSSYSTRQTPAARTLGGEIRKLREERDLPLWQVAHAGRLDSALLSKIERGQRLPTEEQTAAFAKYFGANLTTWESMRIAERILHEHGHNPEAAALALARIQENAASHPVNRKRVAVNYRRKPVQKSKKKA